jgi:MraZ protein
MFRGNYPATVDGKGRLKFPAAIKVILDDIHAADFYVTSHDGQSARIYPFQEWLKIEEKLKQQPSMNRSVKKFLDRTNYYGQTARADSQGRILIPSILRESAAMQGEVAVFGYLNYLEVWNNQRYLEHLEKDPFTDEDMKNLSDLGI